MGQCASRCVHEKGQTMDDATTGLLHRLTAESSRIHLTRHPHYHPYHAFAVDKFGLDGSFQGVELLGRGGTSATWLFQDLTDGKQTPVAIKLQQRPLSLVAATMLFNEAVFLSNEGAGSIHCPTIRELVMTPTHVGQVLQLEGGGTMANHVADALPKVGRLDLSMQEEKARFFFKQLVAGVLYLHSRQIAHRDIKLDNVLLSDRGPTPTLKLADFQFAYKLSADHPRKSTAFLGTPVYMSPELLEVRFHRHREVLQQHNYDPICADVWACGIWLVAMLVGGFPYDYDLTVADAEVEAEAQIRDRMREMQSWRESPFVKPFLHKLTPECKDLLDSMLEKDPCKRISTFAVSKHPWVAAQLQDPALEQAWERVQGEQRALDAKIAKLHVNKELLERRNAAVSSLIMNLGTHVFSAQEEKSVDHEHHHGPIVDGTIIPNGWLVNMRLEAVAEVVAT